MDCPGRRNGLDVNGDRKVGARLSISDVSMTRLPLAARAMLRTPEPKWP
jgi:hypothetical protein